MFYVDVWFLACGIPFDKCICFAKDAKIKLTIGVYKTTKKYDPNDAVKKSFDLSLTNRGKSISDVIQYLQDIEQRHEQELNEEREKVVALENELRNSSNSSNSNG